MFVVFEGIDGSGKTTVSNKVAKVLRRRGLAVEHVREGGEFASPLVGRMREFGKDPRNMAMAPLTELLFYVARDAQLLAECIQPALRRGGLVFADRYLYSYEVLSHHGRGVPMDQVRPILDAVSGGVWPDLVVYLDVEPTLARARRKVGKLIKKSKGGKPGGGSRKGLQGVGTQHRLRAGYLELAERDPERWLVVDNADVLSPESRLDAIVQRIAGAIERIWQGQRISEVVRNAAVEPGPRIAAETPELEAGRDAFFQLIEARAARELPIAAYLLAGIGGERAHDLRESWAQKSPHMVAYGLRGLADDRAWELRERLRERTPYFVARSLDGRAVQLDPRVEQMRREFVDSQPQAVLSTIDSVDTEAAWELRERLAERALPEVLTTLKRLPSDRAWELRSRLESQVSDPMAMAPLVSSIRGLADDRAWAIRDRYLDVLPSQVLASLSGVEDARSWVLRSRFASQAPKIVLRTIDGMDDARAWALRRVYAPRVKEALDSMVGLDSDVAWAIRDECLSIWPSTTTKSLGLLASSERGREMVREALAQHPEDISLLKHVTRLAGRTAGRLPGLEKVG
ncbi:dTMP kinase [Haliangium ochraceum]|uniref:Thymidylate kinase n=1 Tax=Haliangium ochraceum (strain DSM 14365 / JCM 11303 / SMP-2) TaxID=502025 RepID=D0LG69_HALO1|nr:dTMP kinase [Haliangium ochraceum]ACY18094.1 thymidylate kinase [Haliangium ochraceum DSM 14365]